MGRLQIIYGNIFDIFPITSFMTYGNLCFIGCEFIDNDTLWNNGFYCNTLNDRMEYELPLGKNHKRSK